MTKYVKTFEGWFFQMNFDLTSNKPMDSAEESKVARMSICRKTLVEMAAAMFSELGTLSGDTKGRIEYMLENTVIGTTHTHTGDVASVLLALAANIPGIQFDEDDMECYVKSIDEDAGETFIFDPKVKVTRWYEKNRAAYQQMEDDRVATRKQMKSGGNNAPDWGRNSDGSYDVQ